MYDIVVVGAGHAGCEAALACARMGLKTLLLTLNLEGLAMMACNPSIGGTAKGHLVREVDALGGEMGKAIDDVYIQSRMINTGKGPAVQSLRAQADKKAYQQRMMKAIQQQENLTLKQGEVSRFELDETGKICAVYTATGARYGCKAAVVAAGVYMSSRIITGDVSIEGGPSGLRHASFLSGALQELGFSLRRFKTGTPARIDIRTVDLTQFDEQPGDTPVVPFSFLSPKLEKEQISCYLGYTTEETHSIIRANLHRAPMYRGDIKGTGARYCPSIEDKVVRFSERERHPIFLEPEGVDTVEWYVQGMSSSMPEDVQIAMYRSIPGMENVELMRLAYAIEYDVIDSTVLTRELQSKEIPGLYFAGQINGTSGYEEAAAQGIYAGINAALAVQGKEPLHIGRDEGYLGVMVDDLTLKGTDEPYRMMTSRAEYRLLLRQSNADFRLTERSYEAGLATKERYEAMLARKSAVEDLIAQMQVSADAEAAAKILQEAGEPPVHGGVSWKDLLVRPQVAMRQVLKARGMEEAFSPDVVEEAEIQIKYAGYLLRQEKAVKEARQAEEWKIPTEIDYMAIEGIRIEARQKLARVKPDTLGMASRIPGVNPSDVAVLMVKITAMNREKTT